MQSIFLFCALAGSTILLLQFVLTLFSAGADELGLDGADAGDAGFGDDLAGSHDGADHDASSLFKKITFRSMIAGVAFFGIGGMVASTAGLESWACITIALFAGGGALYAVGWLFQSLHRLSEAGNLQIEQSVGLPATVYIPIPGNQSGTGKIQLKLQNRIVELRAVTFEEDRLATGTNVVVVEVINSSTVAVELARQPVKT